jgi:hypothetical protein
MNKKLVARCSLLVALILTWTIAALPVAVAAPIPCLHPEEYRDWYEYSIFQRYTPYNPQHHQVSTYVVEYCTVCDETIDQTGPFPSNGSHYFQIGICTYCGEEGRGR